MEKEKKYYAFRANIAFEDRTLLNYKEEDNKENRNKIFRDFFNQLKKDKLKSSYAKREYILLYVDDKEDIVYCKLARKKNININGIEDYTIKERTEEHYPYVNIYVELKHQKILIENNSTVFENNETCKKTIENIIKNNIKYKNATITLNPIVKENEFKKHIKNSEYIYSIKFKLNVPNWLEGETAAEDFLKVIHDTTFGDSVELTIKNKTGNLELDSLGINSFVDYSDKGAGKWEIIYKEKGGNKTTIKSGDLNEYVKFSIDDNIMDSEIADIRYSTIKKAFNQVEQIEKFREKI